MTDLLLPYYKLDRDLCCGCAFKSTEHDSVVITGGNLHMMVTLLHRLKSANPVLSLVVHLVLFFN